MHWTTPFLGLPYERGAAGPAAFDCWSFFRHVQSARFGRTLPDVPAPDTARGIVRALAAGRDPAGWRLVDRPDDGDGVLLSRLVHPAHVGIWADDLGAVLHCVEGSGSVLSDSFHLRAGRWRVHGYYRPSEA